jgi:hypothetical protein
MLYLASVLFDTEGICCGHAEINACEVAAGVFLRWVNQRTDDLVDSMKKKLEGRS